MTKKTDAEKLEARKLVALDRIAESLQQIEAVLSTPKKTRWYEASWRAPNEYAYSQRCHRVSVEAYDAEEARNILRGDLKLQPTVVGSYNGDDGMLLRHLADFQLRPLGDRQCRYCCMTNWAEDGERCLVCHRTPEEALKQRRAGRFDAQVRDRNGEW